ncbi:MAG: SprT family zinc-dependent metalloprotease [Desulfosporosinus sp.]
MAQLHLGEIIIDVEEKNIKNIHLRVYPPAGKVRITAPLRMGLDTIRVFALSKLNWIRKQQAKLRGQEREAPRDFLNRESHYYNGKRFLLEVVEFEAPPKIELRHSTLVLYVRPGTPKEKRQRIIDAWYRAQLKNVLPELIEKWEKKLNVKVAEYGIKKMKTRWGSCNCQAKRIWLNLELAKKPQECLEYVVVHEMVHLLVRKHNAVFRAYMTEYLPKWRSYKDELNRLAV